MAQGMTLTKVTVYADDGDEVEADLVICPSCAGHVWSLFFLPGADDAHMQCETCHTSFCSNQQCKAH